MRFKLKFKVGKSDKELQEWHDYFIWFPRILYDDKEDKVIVWGNVERRLIVTKNWEQWEFKL